MYNCDDDNGCFGEGDIPPNSENRPPPADAYDPNGAKAPGKPGAAEGFNDPSGGDDWAPNLMVEVKDGKMLMVMYGYQQVMVVAHMVRLIGMSKGQEVEVMKMFILVDEEGKYEKYSNN